MKIFENHFLTFDKFPHQNGRILMRWDPAAWSDNPIFDSRGNFYY